MATVPKQVRDDDEAGALPADQRAYVKHQPRPKWETGIEILDPQSHIKEGLVPKRHVDGPVNDPDDAKDESLAKAGFPKEVIAAMREEDVADDPLLAAISGEDAAVSFFGPRELAMVKNPKIQRDMMLGVMRLFGVPVADLISGERAPRFTEALRVCLERFDVRLQAGDVENVASSMQQVRRTLAKPKVTRVAMALVLAGCMADALAEHDPLSVV